MSFCLKNKPWYLLGVLSITLLIHGCTSIPQGAPIIDEKPKGIETSPDTSSSFPTDSCTYHIVARGETLAGIATRCSLNYKDVARWNKIPPPYMINPGQTLVLYGPAEPTPPPSSSTIPSSVSSNPSSTTSNSQDSQGESEYHTVAPGDTLFNIAKHYGCTMADLRNWNNLASDNLSIGQRLKISGSPTNSTVDVHTALPPSQTTKTTSYGEKTSGQHIVAHGDTLYSVAKLYGYSAADIAAWNGLQPPYNLSIGQILTVNPPASVASSPPKISPNTSGEHIVAQGDTLYKIAKHYGCTIDELKSWNNLSNNEVSVGQRLLVSSKNLPTSLSPPSINTLQHEVHAGETMYSIATKYGVNPTDLAQLNGIGPPYTVYPGQKLTIIPKH